MNDDAITARLTALHVDLAHELGDAVRMSVDQLEVGLCVELTPSSTSALPLSWIDLGSELQLEAGHHGGRWELTRDQEGMDFLEDVTRSVVAGRVVEVFGPGRSGVQVTLGDGRVASETGFEMGRGCLPVPGWRQRGRVVQYAPYVG